MLHTLILVLFPLILNFIALLVGLHYMPRGNVACLLLLKFKREIKVWSGMKITLKCARGVSTTS